MKKFIIGTIVLALLLYVIAFFVYCSAFIFEGAREVLNNIGFGFLTTGFFLWALDVILIFKNKKNE